MDAAKRHVVLVKLNLLTLEHAHTSLEHTNVIGEEFASKMESKGIDNAN